jgi:hypothetical protein
MLHSASFSFPASKIVAFSTLLTFLDASVEAAVTVAFEERPLAMMKSDFSRAMRC